MRDRLPLANDLALALRLGRLAETWAIRQVYTGWSKLLGESEYTTAGLQNSSAVAFARGRLAECRSLARAGLMAAARVARKNLLAFRADAAHALGDIPAARADFAYATELEGEPL